MECEDWKPIVGFDGLYEVSSLGRVRSLPRVVIDKNGKRTRYLKGRILQNVCAQTGYHMVSLHRNAERVSRRTVHRLVMEAFNPISKEGLIVDHINGVRHDNRLSNLRWVNFNVNNNNTPYIRYLQSVLKGYGIMYISEEDFGSNID